MRGCGSSPDLHRPAKRGWGGGSSPDLHRPAKRGWGGGSSPDLHRPAKRGWGGGSSPDLHRPAKRGWGGGFTIIELVVTVGIVSLLATAVVPSARLVYQRERERELRSSLRTIRAALDAYKLASDTGHVRKQLDRSGYPPDLRALVDGVDDASNPKGGVKLYFLRSLPRDPFWPDAATPAEDTWAPRAYASPPGDPQPGDDVYDVHSRSPRTGLNGVPYRDW